jgi:hypothetical protein
MPEKRFFQNMATTFLQRSRNMRPSLDAKKASQLNFEE